MERCAAFDYLRRRPPTENPNQATVAGWGVMSPLGQSRPTLTGVTPGHVRCTSKATVNRQKTTRREGPRVAVRERPLRARIGRLSEARSAPIPGPSLVVGA
jgi:hypothetical protein